MFKKTQEPILRQLVTGLLVVMALMAPSLALAVDLSVTAANVSLTSASVTSELVTAGESIAQGKLLYLDSATSRYKLADADSSATTAAATAIALTPGTNGEKIYIVKRGPMDVGASLTVGARYYASGTAGGIAPEADLATGDYVTLVGIATASGVLNVNIYASGVQVP